LPRLRIGAPHPGVTAARFPLELGLRGTMSEVRSRGALKSVLGRVERAGEGLAAGMVVAPVMAFSCRGSNESSIPHAAL